MKKSKKKHKLIWKVNAVLFVILIVLLIVVLKFGNLSNSSSKSVQTNTVKTNVVTDSPKQTVVPDSTTEPQTQEVDGKAGEISNTKEAKSIQMVFTGDVLLSDSTLGRFRADGLDGLISDSLLNSMKQADFTMVNQEFPFSNRGTKMQDKQYTFRADPSYVSIFTDMGIDMVSLANNHTLDFGYEALEDTFDTLDQANIEYIGAGENLERAKEILYRTIGETKIACIAASRVIPVAEWNATNQKAGLLTTYDPTILLEQIKKAEEEADITVVYLHWGIERKDKPEEYQRNLAMQYIDAGADLVIGSHPHCLQGIEYYNERPIVYSLGNFIFGDTIDQTALLNVTLQSEDNIKLSLIPCYSKNAKTQEIEDQENKIEFYKYIEQISFDVTISDSGEVSNALK